MIAHWEKKLRNLQLDQDTSATEYINSFEMYVRKLTELGENWSDAKKVREFKLNVIDDDYETEIRVHSGDCGFAIESTNSRGVLAETC